MGGVFWQVSNGVAIDGREKQRKTEGNRGKQISNGCTGGNGLLGICACISGRWGRGVFYKIWITFFVLSYIS